MRNDRNDPSDQQSNWNNNAGYPDPYSGGAYDDYGDDEDYEGYDIDEELSSEHNFRVAMNVFDLIGMLVGLAAVLLLTSLLFSLFNWVQRDISQSLSVFTAAFR